MFAFTSRSKMESDVKNGRYLEHGEYEGNLYGIKTESIQEVIEAGRVCILDPNPQVGTKKTATRQLITAHTHTHTLCVRASLLPLVSNGYGASLSVRSIQVDAAVILIQ